MGKFLETWTPANCTQLRGLQQNQSVPASWAWQDQSSAGCSPPPHTISLVPGSYRWAVPTQPSLEMLKLRRPWRKPCQEQAAGAASGRQEQQWRKDTKLQIFEGHEGLGGSRLNRGVKVGQLLASQDLAPAPLRLSPTGHSQVPPFTWGAPSTWQETVSAWHSHTAGTSAFLLAGHSSPVILAGGAALSLFLSASKSMLLSLMSLQFSFSAPFLR